MSSINKPFVSMRVKCREESFKKHKSGCLRHGDYHKFSECPYNHKGFYPSKCCGALFAHKVEKCPDCRKDDKEKKQRRRSEKFVAQMFGGLLSPVVHTVDTNTLDDVQNRLETVLQNTITTSSDAATNLVADIKDQVKTTFDKDSGFFSLLTEIIIGFTLIYRVREDKISAGLALTQLLLSLGIAQSVIEACIKFISENLGTSNFEAQTFDVSKPVMSVLFFFYVLIFGRTCSAQSLIGFLNSSSRLPVLTNVFSDVGGFVSEMCKTLIDWIKYSFLGYDKVVTEEKVDAYLEWAENVDKLYVGSGMKNNEWDIDQINKADALYESGLELRKTFAACKPIASVAQSFGTRFTLLQKILEEISSCGARQRFRLDPFMFYMCGATQMGKSHMTPIFISYYLKKFHPELLKENDYSSQLFLRNSGDARWDGYCGQKVVLYDDFGQVKDSENCPNPEMLEIIRLANSAPFIPEMAALNKKGKTKVEPELVVCTSNTMRPYIGSLTEAKAVYRRFDLILEATPIPEVATANARVMDHKEAIRRHTIKDCKCATSSEFCYSAIQFKRWKYSISLDKHVEEGGFMDLDQVLDLFRQEMLSKREKTEANAEFIKNYATEDTNFIAEGGSYKSVEDFVRDYNKDETEANMHFELWLEKLSGGDSDLEYVLRSTMLTEDYSLRIEPFKWQLKTVPMPCISSRLATIKEQLSIDETRFKDFLNSTMLLKIIGVLLTGALGVFLLPKLFSYFFDSPCEAFESYSAESPRGGLQHNRNVRHRAEAPHEFIIQGVEDKHLEVTERIVMRNLYEVKRYILGGKGQLMQSGHAGSALAVKGRALLTFAHLLSVQWDKLVFTNVVTKQEYSVSRDELEHHDIMDSRGQTKDLTLILMPRKFPQAPDITKHFTLANDTVFSNSLDVRLITSKDRGYGHVATIVCGTGKVKDTVISYSMKEDTTIVIRQHIRYHMDTVGGDCGSPLLWSANSQSRKILGIHVAGHIARSEGISSYISQELLLKSIDSFKAQIADRNFIQQGTFYVDFEDEVFVAAKNGLDGFIAMPDLEPLNYFPDMRDDLQAVGTIGRLDDGVSENKHSSLRETPVCPDFGELVKCPAQLDGFYEGEHVRHNARKKLIRGGDISLDKDMLKQAGNMVLGHIQAASGDHVKRKILTFDDAVFGSEESQYYKSLEVNTSAGYPWVKKSKKNGKKGFINLDSGWASQELKESVDFRIGEASCGRRVPTVWTDHLKDETRKIEGDKCMKPRLFCGGPVDHVIASRMYFGAFAASCMHGRVENGIAVGINPHNDEWGLLARSLLDNSTDIFCGDFSNYDGTLNAEIMWTVLDIINKWYDHFGMANTGNDNTIRKVLFSELVNAIHLSRNDLYYMDQGNPSGNFLTSLLNSIYQHVAFAYLWQVRYGTGEVFYDDVYLCVYGDDNIVSVVGGNDTLPLDWLCEAFGGLGMKLTSAQKNGLPEYCTLDECDFISRKFVLRDGYWCAPLAESTLKEAMYFMNKRNTWQFHAENVAITLLYEASHYTGEGFRRIVTFLGECNKVREFKLPILQDQDYYRQRLRTGTYAAPLTF